MGNTTKGLPLTLTPLRLDDQVRARIGEFKLTYPTINQALRERLLPSKDVQLIDAPISSLPEPSETIGAVIYRRPKQPCIYAWMRGQECLYVGKSTRGTSRPLGLHHVIDAVEPFLDDDTIEIWYTVPELLDGMELSFMKLLRPSLNKRLVNGSKRVSFSCSILPKTLEAILETAKAEGLSQGEVIDKAVALLAFGESIERVPKLSKAKQQVAEIAAADVTARAVDRDDVDYERDALPTQHIMSVPPVQAPAKIDPDNLPDVKPVGMPRAQWEMLQRKKNPPPPPSWRLDTIAIGKPGVRK